MARGDRVRWCGNGVVGKLEGRRRERPWRRCVGRNGGKHVFRPGVSPAIGGARNNLFTNPHRNIDLSSLSLFPSLSPSVVRTAALLFSPSWPLFGFRLRLPWPLLGL